MILKMKGLFFLVVQINVDFLEYYVCMHVSTLNSCVDCNSTQIIQTFCEGYTPINYQCPIKKYKFH